MCCENEFCVYYRENTCILDEISVDVSGLCRECILVNIDEGILKEQRQKFLDRE